MLKPQIVFVESLDDTYSDYDRHRFENFQVFHEKLEIKALQLLSKTKPFIYVPVLNVTLGSGFDNKFSELQGQAQHQAKLSEYHSLVSKYGFDFLNSDRSTEFQTYLRELEIEILGNKELINAADLEINKYEDCMLKNIDIYSRSHNFINGVFLCGVAHRQSIMSKTDESHSFNVHWKYYETSKNFEI